eukprot:scaffold71_cov265-Chaetoceros_neogracile.AAC.42
MSRALSSSSRKRPFDKILIANRGEIACRVIRTAKKLGIKTVALYSVADGPDAIHASMANEAYLVGTGPKPSESYLLQDRVIEIAINSGAQAIHPGYGFLSENSSFSTAVQEAGISFIGPSASAILAMGSKSHSKIIMENAKVPTTPGYHGDEQDPQYLFHEAVTSVGFPLLIKATMGGGGKGMRLVLNESDFLEALESCKRESQAAFGDARVILERYLVHPRHIEIQVMADTHGNVVHLHERDCSLQRRHQKIIEEAPSNLSSELRQMMGDTAVKAAKAVNYVNAGTVEFLLDTQSNDGDFYFCEMNTRLQVEHPVTEMITEQDLVEWQLRIAAGEELPIKNQDLIPCIGNSMEARIYAENPAKDFLPATGHVWHHHPPFPPNIGGKNVRVDTGLQEGKDISVYYDPMISKLIVHGKDREEARVRLIESLQNYQIAGVPTNIPFLIKCAQHPVFAEAGAINTGFLDDYADDVKAATYTSPMDRAVCGLVASLALEARCATDLSTTQQNIGPWSTSSGSWRLGTRHERVLKIGEETFPMTLKASFHTDKTLRVLVNGSEKQEYIAISKNRASSVLAMEGKGSIFVKAPMPGTITRMNFQEGDNVGKSDVILVMEAMKMEHAVTAKMAGIISKLSCEVGDIINDSDVLCVLREDTLVDNTHAAKV